MNLVSKYKKTTILVVSVLIFFSLLFLAGWLFFPKAKILKYAEDQATKAAGTKVKIGDAGLKFFPLGLSLQNIQVGEDSKPSLIPFVKLKQLAVGVELWPLLKKQINIDYILLDEPVIVVYPLPASPDLKEPVKASPDASKSSLSLSLKKLNIRNGDIKIKDEKGTILIHLGELNETLSAKVSTSKQIDLEGVLSIGKLLYYLPAGALGQGLTLSLDKKLSYHQEEDLLHIEKGHIKLGDLALEIAGKVKGSTREDTDIDIILKGGPANVKSILAYLPAKLFPAVEGVSSEGIVSLEAFIKGIYSQKQGFQKSVEKTLDYLISFSLKNGKLKYPSLPKPIEGLELSFTANPRDVEISRFYAATSASKIELKGKVSDYLKTPNLDIYATIAADLTEAKSMQPKSSQMDFSGKVLAEVRAKGTTEKPSVTGQLEVKSVQFFDPTIGVPALKNLNGKLILKDDVMTVSSLKGLLGQSDFNVQGRFLNYRAMMPDAKSKNRPSFDLAMTNAVLNLDELTPKEPKDPNQKTDLSLIEKIDGSVNLNSKDVTFNKMKIKNVVGRAILKNGVFDLKEFSVQVFGGAVKLSGLADMKDLKSPLFDLNLGIQDVQAAEVLSYSSGLNKLGQLAGFFTGKLSTNVAFKGGLTESLELKMNSLTSKGVLEFLDSKVSNHPVQNQLSQMLDAPSLKSLALKNWVQPFEIKEGKLHVQNMKLGNQDFQIKMNGYQALDGTTKMDMDLDIPQKWAQGIKNLLPGPAASLLFDNNPEARMELPLTLTGLISSPNIGLNQPKLTSLVETKLAAKLKTEQNKLQEKATDKVESIIKDKVPTQDLKKKLKKLF